MEKKTAPKKSTSKKSTTKTAVKKAATKTVNKKRPVVKATKNKPAKYNKQPKKDANTGYILGLSSMLAWVIPVVGAIVTVTGIYCCYKGMKGRKGIALLGLILNMLFLGLAIINIEADFALMN